MKRAVLLNVSGQKMPSMETLKEYLKKNKYTEAVEFHLRSKYDLREGDIWEQVESRIRELKREVTEEKSPYDLEGDYFIFLPAIAPPALMLGIAFKELLGVYPHLVVVTKIGITPTVTQIINLEAFKNKCKTSLYAELVSEATKQYSLVEEWECI